MIPERAHAEGAPQLATPVDCDMATMCSIQKYVDRAPGSQRLDYRCGTLTTDSHDGIDFRVRSAADMARDIPVLAAAAGVVLRVRDGMPDIDIRAAGTAGVGERLAGNAVVIGHGHGWETQYSHLKRGSVRVSAGQKLAAGARIGTMGMSGNAEYPHLHFEVRHGRQTVDPFAPQSPAGCSETGVSLWRGDVIRRLGYRGTEALAAGFSTSPPEALKAPASLVRARELNDPPALLLWGNAAGVVRGDVQHFRVAAPNGGVIHESSRPIDRNALSWTGFSGMRRPAAGWDPGLYEGYYQLIRNGKVMSQVRSVITVTK